MRGALQLDQLKLSAVAQLPVDRRVAPDAEVELARIYSEKQVRRVFRHLDDLAQSIRLNGIIEPLVVHEQADGRFRLIVGERRLRAAAEAGLTKVPVVIRRGLDELAIRRLQVSENNDRDDLTAYEEAMGVLEDVQRFGAAEAARIWNRSDAWISKRVGVSRYHPPVFDLLKSEVCSDFEVLQSLHQLYTLSVTEFEGLVGRLRAGASVGREDVRTKVASVKEWGKKVEAARAHGDTQAKRESPGSATSALAMAAPNDGHSPSLNAPPAVGDRRRSVRERTPVPPVAEGNKATDIPSADTEARVVRTHSTADLEAAQGVQDMLRQRRVALYKAGAAVKSVLDLIHSDMTALELELAEGEWVLWNGFLDVMVPMLEALGKERSLAYMRRLSTDLRSRTATALRCAQGGRAASPGEGCDDRSPIAEMPEGWTF